MNRHLRAAERVFHLMQHLKYPTLSSLGTQQAKALSTRPSVLDTRRSVSLLESHISYLDTGNTNTNQAVVFLHGNPTSSYLWRNIIPHVQGVARCVAPDLLGMGKSGKEPKNSYTYADHYRYLSAWLDYMDLPQKLTFVLHDWGGGLGFHWCHQHQERVQGIVYMETLVSVIPNWELFPELARNVFQALRSEAGEDMVLQNNFFVERLLPGAILRNLSEDEMNAYREPFLTPGESRRPTLTWPREIPIVTDGPQYVVDIVNAYNAWLQNSKDVPKLYIDPEPGFFSEGIRQAVKDWPNQRVVKVKGSHFLQEDSPDEIGKAISDFVKEL